MNVLRSILASVLRAVQRVVRTLFVVSEYLHLVLLKRPFRVTRPESFACY